MGFLALYLRRHEKIVFGDNIEIFLGPERNGHIPNNIKIIIDAPKDVVIRRERHEVLSKEEFLRRKKLKEQA